MPTPNGAGSDGVREGRALGLSATTELSQTQPVGLRSCSPRLASPLSLLAVFFTHFLFYVNKFMYFCIDSHIIINHYGKKLEED